MDEYEMATAPGFVRGPSAEAKVRDAIGAGFARLQLRQRVRVLRRLLVPIGPMALVVIAGGAFARYARQARSPRMRLAAEDVARVTPAQVLELARYVAQSKPSALQQALRVIRRGGTRPIAPIMPF